MLCEYSNISQRLSKLSSHIVFPCYGSIHLVRTQNYQKKKFLPFDTHTCVCMSGVRMLFFSETFTKNPNFLNLCLHQYVFWYLLTEVESVLRGLSGIPKVDDVDSE